MGKSLTIKVPLPDAGGRFYTTEEASRWLRLSETKFEELMRAECFRPVREGKKLLWDVTDVFVLGHLMQRRASSGGEEDSPRKKNPEEK